MAVAFGEWDARDLLAASFYDECRTATPHVVLTSMTARPHAYFGTSLASTAFSAVEALSQRRFHQRGLRPHKTSTTTVRHLRVEHVCSLLATTLLLQCETRHLRVAKD